MVEMLKLQIATFNLPPQPMLDEYEREIAEAIKSSRNDLTG
jgi:hypothetical protein